MGANCSSNKRPGYVIHDMRDILNFKIILIGDCEVGKSGVFNRYVKNQFDGTYRPTQKPVVENVMRKVNVPDDLVASVTLWDLPGREDVDMRDSYYRNVDAAIVVVDLSDADSIKLAGSWKQDLINRASKAYTVTEVLPNGHKTTTEKAPFDAQNVPVLLLGNKYDLIEAAQQEKTLRDIIKKPIDQSLDNMSLSEDVDSVNLDNGSVEESIQAASHESPIKRRHLGHRQDEEEEKLECVKLMEEIEEKFGFIGSLSVSARNADGSVERALQALARHLLEEVRPPKMKIPKAEDEAMTMRKKKKAKVDEKQYILYCGVESMDEVFYKCYAPVRRADDYETYYGLMLDKFKQKCLENGFLLDPRAGLEDCIIGINSALQQLGNIQLKAENEAGFVYLTYTEVSPAIDIPDEIEDTLELFNKEFAVACVDVLKEKPLLDTVLSRLHDAVAKMGSQLLTKYGNRADQYIHVCDKNRARIVFAQKQVQDNVLEVEKSLTKIRTALKW